MKVDISSRRHIGYAIIAKCSASAQAISGARRVPSQHVPHLLWTLRIWRCWQYIFVCTALLSTLTAIFQKACAGST